jgi:hypothetical protein
MKKNVGLFDRVLRLVLSVGVFALAYIHVLPDGWNIITWCVGGMLLLTAAIGRCPLYGVCGIGTRSPGGSDSSQTPGAPGPGGTANPKVS